MIREVLTGLVRGPGGKRFIVVKVPKGTIQTAHGSQEVMDVLRKRLPAEQLVFEIVILDGEPLEQPGLFGSCAEIESYARSILYTLATTKLKLTKLEWRSDHRGARM